MNRSTIRSVRSTQASNEGGPRRAALVGTRMLAAALLLCGCQGSGGGNATPPSTSAGS